MPHVTPMSYLFSLLFLNMTLGLREVTYLAQEHTMANGKPEPVIEAADSEAPGLPRTLCTDGNKRISPLNPCSPFPSKSFPFHSLSTLLRRGVLFIDIQEKDAKII